jgi:ABC-type multidrug transport system ATPase subunit
LVFDIIHTQLTVYRALYYTARLRLPTDTDPAELHARIESVIEEMELGPHRDTLAANLSGGQIKRVSLGAELLAQPCLLYIDEATSGLDAGTNGTSLRRASLSMSCGIARKEAILESSNSTVHT